jgi:hypothetical protein
MTVKCKFYEFSLKNPTAVWFGIPTCMLDFNKQAIG